MPNKILIIDDDIDTLHLVNLMLQNEGYHIVTATNGAEGMLKMSKEIPNLIILDVMMPEMDGYEVSRLLRQNPKTADVPILMFTAKSQLDDKVAGFESGADGYLTKPTHPTELLAHIKTLLSRSVKRETEQTAPQDQRAFTLPKDKRTYTVGIISDRFSEWFKNAPSDKGK